MGLETVSVIIPTYNRARTLPDAIESVLAQTRSVDEILVIDDGSQDGTAQIVTPYLSKIRYLRQENRGAAAARNTAIREAKGELIALLDSDDTWYPHKIERQLPAFANPDVGLVYADLHVISPNGEPRPNFIAGKGACSGMIFGSLLGSDFILPTTVIFRRKCIEDVGYFDETLKNVEDYDLWLRICRKYPVQLIDEPLAVWRLQSDSLTTHIRRMSEGSIQVFQKWLADPDLSSEERKTVHRRLATYHFIAAFEARDVQRRLALQHISQSLIHNTRDPIAWKCLASMLLPLNQAGRTALKSSVRRVFNVITRRG